MRRILILSVYMICAAACGAESPTAPTPQPPTSLLGAWLGNYFVSSCNETGSAIGTGFCTNLGIGGRLSYTPTQTGSTLGGNLTMGAFTLPVSGSVTTDNVVSLSGSGEVVSGATLSLNAFRATVSGNAMTGTMTFTILVGIPLGAGTVTATTSLLR